MNQLTYDFADYTPRSRRWVEFAEGNQLDQLLEEATRTTHAIAATAAAKVDKGQLTPEQVAILDRTWRSIANDLQADKAARENWRPIVLEAGVPWADKVAAIRAEILARRKSYPADVDKGRLAPDVARSQLERLEAVHWTYWRHGFAFDGDQTQLRQHMENLFTAEFGKAAA